MRFLFALFLLVFTSPAFAEPERYVTLDVFAAQSAVQPGESVDIAIRQNIYDGWHTYWFNAGDSGEPLTVEWNAPETMTISDIQFPTPSRIPYDPLINFGYYGAPIYTQTLTIADNFEGDKITLNTNALWLVCDEICIPESQEISITIPIGDGEPTNQNIFKTAKENMPQTVDWNATFYKSGSDVILNVDVPNDLKNQMTDVEIFPYDWGIIKTTSPIISDIQDDKISFSAQRSDRDFAELDYKNFVLKTSNDAYEINATLNTTAINPSDNISLIAILLFAFLGGIILNLMPCVFPVLSMKALSLVKLSDKERKHARASGLAYTSGIILSFLIIAGSLIILKNAGESIGWGFQLQNPYVVTALATLLFLIGLNLLGLFEIGGRFMNVGSKLTSGNDTKSSFFTGVLATLVATPCTAPFMATAIGYALTQNAFISLLVFAMLGLGLAFPYLLLSFIPAVQKILPRPGAWMDTFKQALAWPMFASVIWLVWVLAQQAGSFAIAYILALFLAITFILWLFKKSSSKFVKIGFLAFLVGVFISYSSILSPKDAMNYEPYDATKLESVLRDNPDQPVFINMTAAWCITCLVNEQTSLSQKTVKQAFADANILYMKGDWTNRDSDITKFLEGYGRNGVPLYVFYGVANENGQRPEPVLLPQILTPDIVLTTIKGD